MALFTAPVVAVDIRASGYIQRHWTLDAAIMAVPEQLVCEFRSFFRSAGAVAIFLMAAAVMTAAVMFAVTTMMVFVFTR